MQIYDFCKLCHRSTIQTLKLYNLTNNFCLYFFMISYKGISALRWSENYLIASIFLTLKKNFFYYVQRVKMCKRISI